MIKDFSLYAKSKCNVSPIIMSQYASYITPNILEPKEFRGQYMDVFDRLLMERIIFLGVPITSDVCNIVQAQMLYLDSVSHEDITLYLNTPGGEVVSGLAVYDTMQLISSDVSTICTGMAASMGSILLCGGAAGKRAMLPHSKVMIHQPLGGVEGQASDILIEAKEIEKAREELYKIIAKHSNQPYKKVFKDSDRNYWMSAEEALAYGMVDQIITKEK